MIHGGRARTVPSRGMSDATAQLMNRQIVGNVSSLDQARGLVTALEREAFGTDEITVLYPEGEASHQATKALASQEVQGRGALFGACVGGVVGLMLGALVASGYVHASALRPLVDSGAFVSVFLGVLMGVLAGSILGMAFGKRRSPRGDGRNPSAILVAVEVRTDDRAHQAHEVMVAFGAANVATRN